MSGRRRNDSHEIGVLGLHDAPASPIGIGVSALALGRSDAFLSWAEKMLGTAMAEARDLPAALSVLRERAVDLVVVSIPDLEFRPQRAFEALALEAPGVPLIGVDAVGSAGAHARDLDLLVAGMSAGVSLQTPRVDVARLFRSLIRRRDDLRRDAEQHKKLMQQLVRFETWSTRRLDALERWLCELEVPAGVIRAAADGVAGGASGPSRADGISKLASAAAILASLIERGRSELVSPPELDVDIEVRRTGSRTLLSLHDVCGEVVDVLRAEAAKSGVRLRLDERETPKIWADRIRLTQALINLVKHAWCRAARGGSVAIALTPVTEGDDAPWPECSITVTASGSDGSFDAVVADGSDMQAVRQVIDEHGGRLDIDATPGAGPACRIVLPVDPRRRRRRARIRLVSDPQQAEALLDRLRALDMERVALDTADDVEAYGREVAEGRDGVVVVEVPSRRT